MLKKALLVLLVASVASVAWFAGRVSGAPALTPQDHIDIRHTYARYNESIDDGDAEGWVGVWTDDGNFNGFIGEADLMRFARDYLDNQDGARRRHWINNLAISATPEGAVATNYFMILDVSVNPPAVSATGKNRDTFARTSEGWKFTSRTTWDADGNQLVLKQN